MERSKYSNRTVILLVTYFTLTFTKILTVVDKSYTWTYIKYVDEF